MPKPHLEENVFCIALHLRLWPLQHLVAEYRSRNTNVQTIYTNLIDPAAVGDAHFVMRQVHQAGPQSCALSTHHDYRRMLCDRAVVRGKPFGASSNRVYDLAGLHVTGFGT
jgi:hypothetical protein